MRVQWAWLELHEGTWHLLTGVKQHCVEASQKWADEDAALADLLEDGWKIAGVYPNELSDKLKLGRNPQGYSLIRTVH